MNYILTHALIYGIIGGVFTYYLAYGRLLQVSIGALVVGLGYVIYLLIKGNIFEGLSLFVFLFGIYLTQHIMMMRFFPHLPTREVFSTIFTLGSAVFIENFLGFTYGSLSISLENRTIDSLILLASIVFFSLLLWYFFRKCLVGKIFTSICEAPRPIKSLGYPVGKLVLMGSFVWFLVLGIASWMTLFTMGARPSDGFFYLLVGLGIMIACGARGIVTVFGIATAYSALEYMLFVPLNFPIAYKGAIMIMIILLLLLFKPEGILTYKMRTI